MLKELAEAGRVVLGLEMRDYDDDGTSSNPRGVPYDGGDPRGYRDAALDALAREGRDQFGDWGLDDLVS